MSNNYQTLEELTSERGLEDFQQRFSRSPIYTAFVMALRYEQVGLEIVKADRTRGLWATRNDLNTGKIEEIIEYHSTYQHREESDVVLNVDEESLLTIFHELNELDKHPLDAISKYKPLIITQIGFKNILKLTKALANSQFSRKLWP